MVNFEELKRLRLDQIAISKLGYKPTKKDSRHSRSLESPDGVKIITSTRPLSSGVYVFHSPNLDVSGTVIELLRCHDLSFKDINKMFSELDRGEEPLKKPISVDFSPPKEAVVKKNWLTLQQVTNLYKSVQPTNPNLLTKRGLNANILERYKVRASFSTTYFPLYWLKNEELVACSAIQYNDRCGKRFKFFKAARGLSLQICIPKEHLKNPALYFFESPVDGLAYAQLNELSDDSVLVSFCGVPFSDFYKNLEKILKTLNPSKYTICFDSDEVGRKAANKLLSKLPSEYCKLHLPPDELKDWADYL